VKKISFYKISAAGNDFVMIDNRKKIMPKNVSAAARKLCHRQCSVGADGLILLEPSGSADFKMRYYNADGSAAAHAEAARAAGGLAGTLQDRAR